MPGELLRESKITPPCAMRAFADIYYIRRLFLNPFFYLIFFEKFTKLHDANIFTLLYYTPIFINRGLGYL